MKKISNLLLVIAVLFAVPMFVFADIVYGANETANKTEDAKPVDQGDGTWKRTYTFYLDITDEAIPAKNAINVKYTYGKAITSIECTGIDGWTVESKDAGEGTITCVYTPSNDVQKGTKVAIGGWTAIQTKDSVTDDCYVKYSLLNGTSNVDTGSSISYIVVASGIAAAIVAFAISRKKSKLYNL